MGKAVSSVVFFMLSVGMLTLALNTQLAEANGTIYIRADGSIDPPEARAFVNSDDNVTYAFIRNIHDWLHIQRSNITVDGEGLTLQGSITIMMYVSNVTIRNVEIVSSGLGGGIRIEGHTSNNIIFGNNITAEKQGIYLDYSSDNNITGNQICATGQPGYGIFLQSAPRNNIVGNNIFGADYGIVFNSECSENNITRNNITGCDYWGIWFRDFRCSNNKIVKNRIINNQIGIQLQAGPSNNIFGNNITNSNYGIKVHSNNNDITKNNITRSNYGGIWLHYSNTSNITGNNITASYDYGIKLHSSHNNTITQNSITDSDIGMCISNSCDNVARNNSMAGNRYNFWVDGSNSSHFIQDIDMSNTADGKPICYWVNKENMEVPPNVSYVALVGSYNITVSGLELKNNGQGILLSRTESSHITNNTIMNNEKGICQYYSKHNSIHSNSFVNNTVQVESCNSANAWNSSYLIGGNYWSDYVSGDWHRGPYQNETGGDGIGDTPYVIDENNVDHYPLLKNYTLLTIYTTVCGKTDPVPGTYGCILATSQIVTAIPDAGCSFDYWLLDGEENRSNPVIIVMNDNHTLEAFFRLLTDLDKSRTVDILDISIVASAFKSKPDDSNWNPIADLVEPFQYIDILDIAKVAKDYGKTCP